MTQKSFTINSNQTITVNVADNAVYVTFGTPTGKRSHWYINGVQRDDVTNKTVKLKHGDVITCGYTVLEHGDVGYTDYSNYNSGSSGEDGADSAGENSAGESSAGEW